MESSVVYAGTSRHDNGRRRPYVAGSTTESRAPYIRISRCQESEPAGDFCRRGRLIRPDEPEIRSLMH